MRETIERSEMTIIKEKIIDNNNNSNRNSNSNNNWNPLLCVMSKLQRLLKPGKKEAGKEEAGKEEAKAMVVKMVGEEREIISLRLEGDEQCPHHNTNPLLLYQVYAIGGFFVVRWVLARLNERSKKKPSDEEPSPGDD